MTKQTCTDCGTAPGEFHERFCSKERCPFCLGQLVSCGCILKVLELNEVERAAVEDYIDDPVEPLLGINERWVAALDLKGRIPHGSDE